MDKFKLIKKFMFCFRNLILISVMLSLCMPVIAGAESADATPAQTAFNDVVKAYYDNWALDVNYKVLEGFAATSGLPADGDNTFGYERAIKGIAPKDTVITITVYMYDENKSEFYVTNSVTLDPIGTFEFFDKTIRLDNGDNYIVITASHDSSYALAYSVIKCKDFDIKMRLENSISFPGQWINAVDNTGESDLTSAEE